MASSYSSSCYSLLLRHATSKSLSLTSLLLPTTTRITYTTSTKSPKQTKQPKSIPPELQLYTPFFHNDTTNAQTLLTKTISQHSLQNHKTRSRRRPKNTSQVNKLHSLLLEKIGGDYSQYEALLSHSEQSTVLSKFPNVKETLVPGILQNPTYDLERKRLFVKKVEEALR